MFQTIFANTCLSTMNLRSSCSKVLIETIVVLQLAPSDPLPLNSETRFASVDYNVARHRLTDLTLDCPRLTGTGDAPTSEVRTSSILKWLMNYGVRSLMNSIKSSSWIPASCPIGTGGLCPNVLGWRMLKLLRCMQNLEPIRHGLSGVKFDNHGTQTFLCDS
jgi:hypothetical protein